MVGDLTSLIVQAKQGDVAAYSAVVRRFQDTAVGYAYGILGNHDSAKDAAQEAFIEAYGCLGELREPRAFSAWFRRIIFKQCDRITRRRSLTQVPLEVADNVPTIAITLFYLSGYSHQEVADFLQITKSQVNNRLYNARNTLKERIFAMTKATLSEQRPSNDEGFTNRVIDRIRLASPTEDFPRIAELISTDALETTTAQDLLDEHNVDMPERILRHAVAINEQGMVVGFNFAGHYPSMKPHQYFVNVVVDPAHRQQGIGNQLWQDLSNYLREQAANALLADVHEGDPAHYRFAESRGFTPRTHQLHATLDLSTFDEDKFYGFTARVEAMGIRLASFADVEQTEENIRRLYDINGVAALDDPASDGAYINYANWKKVVFGATWFQPEGQMIALDGNKFVGLSAISYSQEEQIGIIMISGVDAAYRERKIMQALKLRAINYARAQGATHIVTNLEAVNAPMRAINQKFGFVEEPGKYEMEATFQ